MRRYHSERFTRFVALLFCLLMSGTPSLGVPIANDPNGFEDLSWGTILSEAEQFIKIEDSGRIQTYEPKTHPPMLGTTVVDSLRLTTFENKLGRVTVRYHGKESHEDIVSYLQAKYGPLDRTPGQIAVGSVKVYAWHGFHTEVTLRFENRLDRGIIFFESRTLPEKLTDETSTTAF